MVYINSVLSVSLIIVLWMWFYKMKQLDKKIEALEKRPHDSNDKSLSTYLITESRVDSFQKHLQGLTQKVDSIAREYQKILFLLEHIKPLKK